MVPQTKPKIGLGTDGFLECAESENQRAALVNTNRGYTCAPTDACTLSVVREGLRSAYTMREGGGGGGGGGEGGGRKRR